MKRFFILFCWIGIFQHAFSQDLLYKEKAKLITTLSFTELTGGIIIIKAQLDNSEDSINFVFDTGSGGASLDSALAIKLGWDIQPSDKIVKGIAGIKKVPFSYHHTIRFNNIELEQVDLHINDYSLLTSVYGIKIDGIIGFTFLRKYIFNIDYDKHLISIFSPGNYPYKRGFFLQTRFYNLPVSEITITNTHLTNASFIYDIGAGLNLLIATQFDSVHHLLSTKHKKYKVQAEGIGGKKLMELSIINKIQIGPYKFKNIPAHFFDDEFNVTNYPSMGGLLGNDILRRFNVVLNYPSQSIYLKPNNYFHDKFDYAYTGLGIYLIDGFITVVDIIKDSPGDKAGFISGDIIFGINNVIIHNIQEFKNNLQNSIGKLNVIVLREGELLPIKIKVQDIRKK